MKTDLRSILIPILLIVLAASVGLPQAQEEEDDDDDVRFGRVFAELGTWIAQPSGLEYYPATEIAPANALGTQVLDLVHGTDLRMRYRGGFEFKKNVGAFIVTYYAHEDQESSEKLRPGQFVFGETLAYPLHAGFSQDGLADAFRSTSLTRLRDLRLDFYRVAFRSRRVTAKWFAGLRRTSHSRQLATSYFAVVPPFPPSIPNPNTTFQLSPNPDVAFVASSFEGRGIEGGMDFDVPLWRDRLRLESGFSVAVLRGKTNTDYESTTHFYRYLGEVLAPEDYDAAFTAGGVSQESFRVGVEVQSLSTNSTVMELYLGLRLKIWKTLEGFAGFRNVDYGDVGIDIEPQPGIFASTPNLQNFSQTDRSANYEGFYLGLSVLF